MKHIEDHQQNEIKELLLGRKPVRVGPDSFQIDNGLVFKVVGNYGCGGCSSGNYDLMRIADSFDSIITSVEFDYAPTSDENGHYRIYVVAAEKRINLFSVEGSDGNGWYGTGFHLEVTPEL